MTSGNSPDSSTERMSQERFKALVGDRKIYIFAVNLEGIGFSRRFARMGLDVRGFIDSRPFNNDMQQGLPVIPPKEFFAREDKHVFVLIATKHQQTRRWAVDLCTGFGLEKNRTFMTSTSLCDLMPTIEVSGLCNLRCISCNMGQPGVRQTGGLMSAATYRKVLEKMSREIPFLNSVYLYLWGEPLVNPDIAEIVRITAELGMASELSSNLIDGRRLEAVVEAQPNVLVVPCSGIGDNFGLTRTGGTWETYRDNLFKLREYIDKHRAETVVRITYHMYKHNMEKDYDTVEGLAKELGFQFFPILAQVFPEYVLRHVIYDEPLPPGIVRADGMLYYSIEEQLKYAQERKDLPCFMTKVFPTVRWDTSVVHCCNLMNPVLTPNYLATSLDELLSKRDANGFCSSCMEHGMHRFFDVVSASVKMEDGKRVLTRGRDYLITGSKRTASGKTALEGE